MIRHDHSHDDDHGEIHITFKPLTNNPNGPISSYQIVVIDETRPTPFYKQNLYNYSRAEKEGIKYWIAAEIDPEWFDYHDEFVVGDGRKYGRYLNHGPLDTDNRDYHVTVGTVSTLNNVTKATYASVSHDQHQHENIIVFKFHKHGDHDDDHDHDHEHGHKHLKKNGRNHRREEQDTLSVGLTVAVVIFAVLFVGVVLFYVALRVYPHFKSTRRSQSDAQELTPAVNNAYYITDMEPVDNAAFTNINEVDNNGSDPLERLKSGDIWQIPRNFLQVSSEVIGKGKFGSVVKGMVNQKGTENYAVVQIVPAKVLGERALKAMVKDVEVLNECGRHENLLGLIGICEEHSGSIFVVLEDGSMTLKQVLLDSRALEHYPAYVEKHQKVSTIPSETIISWLRDIALGMEHLALRKIFHRKLCARNIFIVNDRIKIAGLGIAEYTLMRDHQKPADVLRWTAQEALKASGGAYASKCDVWSYAVMAWEVISLGGTPYSSVQSNELSSRVLRGMRLPQLQGMSEDFYQLLLECWQLDLDERPDFNEIQLKLNEFYSQGAQFHVNYSYSTDFNYVPYHEDLELVH